MTIWGVCLSFALVILFTPIFQFLNISREAYMIQQKVQNDLNSFVTMIGLNSYDKLKNGIFEEPLIDLESFETHIGNSFGLTYDEGKDVWESSDKNFSLSAFESSVTLDDGLKIVVNYKLHIKTKIIGQKLIENEIDKSAFTVFLKNQS